MDAQFWRNIFTPILATCLIAILCFTPLYDRLYGLSVDLLFAARDTVYGQQHFATGSDTVVIALDEQTYQTPPFADVPKVLWTPYIAEVQDAVLAAGAKVVGYDVIFSTSLESYIPGYEKPFLLSLLKASREGKVILGKAQHTDKPVAPHPSQSFVVRNQANIRSLNIHVDQDDIIRRLPLYFKTSTGGRESSMAVELASRALGEKPAYTETGVNLGPYPIPGSEKNAALINFQAGADIPTYSLVDLYACMKAGDSQYLSRHFKDKVVIIGGVLDVEDRKITSKRFMTGEGSAANATRCRVPLQQVKQQYSRETIPGVFIHATAVNNLLRQDFIEELPEIEVKAGITLLTLLVGILTVTLRPTWSTSVITFLIVALTTVSVWLLQDNLLLPLLPLAGAPLFSYLLMSLYRYIIVDRQKSHIRNLFSLYLEPSLVDEMVEQNKLPQLGGELREVTVWFSDLANFTELSEGLEADELVSLMNHYFTAITDLIEAHGGFVDKYIGDAVVGVFGAPLEDPYHAGHAVAAVLNVQKKLQQMNENKEFGDRHIATRTGINTGLAVVGNVGSERRFNYTVMGDTVNLASRLEGANKATGTEILISESVMRKLPKSFLWREIATLRVKGKKQPTRVYEPLAVYGWRSHRREGDLRRYEKKRYPKTGLPQALEENNRMVADFSVALEYYRAREFAKVIEVMQTYHDDKAAQALIRRAERKIHNPPADDWDGADTLSEK